MNRIIQGNILDIQSGIIAHQVNCQRVAGAGLALQIRRKWPAWYTDYFNAVPFMGRASLFYVSKTLAIASLYAQHGYNKNTRQTDYKAFSVSLSALVRNTPGKDLYIPYGIGCGLGGGDWDAVSMMIDAVAPNAILVKL